MEKIVKPIKDWTPEELEKYTEIKASGQVEYLDNEGLPAIETLIWTKEDVGKTEIVNGVKVNSIVKQERAFSRVLNVELIRERVENPPIEQTIIDLREIK